VQVCVYRANGPMDAYLLRHWLERNGIPCHLRGDLSSIRGEIPIPEAWPTVWVHTDLEAQALEALELLNTPTLVHPKWTCDVCNEVNEPNFASCWSCSADRPDVRGRPVH
jgi:hypothetical protein